jgi:hypothetical protein
MREGQSSPWGRIQYVREMGPGAWAVSTAGHGGVKLDRGRNAKVPKPARHPGGWYEEDCDVAIALYVHPDISTADRADLLRSIKSWQSPAVQQALGVA